MPRGFQSFLLAKSNQIRTFTQDTTLQEDCIISDKLVWKNATLRNSKTTMQEGSNDKAIQHSLKGSLGRRL